MNNSSGTEKRPICPRSFSIRGEGAMAVGQKCQLALEWKGIELRCEAEVVWTGTNGEVGLKFLPPDEGRWDL
jgi:hypothetical protein